MSCVLGGDIDTDLISKLQGCEISCCQKLVVLTIMALHCESVFFDSKSMSTQTVDALALLGSPDWVHYSLHLAS